MNTEPSLLELGLAISGTPVDLDRVQISDETAVAQIAESAMAVAGKEMASFSLDGYSQDDGSLLVVTVVGGAEIFRYVVKSGEWREVTDDEAVKQRLQEARAFGDDDGIGPEVEAHKAHHQAFVAAAEAQLASSDGVMLVVCKGEAGMNTLRLFLKLVGAEERVADDWLAGPDHYFVVYSRRKGGEENWSTTWPGADGLSKFLIVASRRCVAIEDTVLVAEGGSFEETAALTRLWATLGGAVLGSAASSKKLEPIASPAAPEATDELSAPTGDPVPYRGEVKRSLKRRSRGSRVTKADLERIKALADLLPELDTFALPHNGNWLLEAINRHGPIAAADFQLPKPLCLIQFTMLQSLPGPERANFGSREIRRRMALVGDLRDERTRAKLRPFLEVDKGLKTAELKGLGRASLFVWPIDDTGDPQNPVSIPWDVSTAGMLVLLSEHLVSLKAEGRGANLPPALEITPAYLLTVLESGYVWQEMSEKQGEDITPSLLRDVINETAAAIQLGFAGVGSIRTARARDMHGPGFYIVDAVSG